MLELCHFFFKVMLSLLDAVLLQIDLKGLHCCVTDKNNADLMFTVMERQESDIKFFHAIMVAWNNETLYILETKTVQNAFKNAQK